MYKVKTLPNLTICYDYVNYELYSYKNFMI